MGQERSEKWTAAAKLQPTLPKPDMRLKIAARNHGAVEERRMLLPQLPLQQLAARVLLQRVDEDHRLRALKPAICALQCASERLVESPVDWYGPAVHAHKAAVDQFPQSPMRGLRLLGRCHDVKEEIHALRLRRGQHRPLVLQVIAAARA